jgi:hypothetical protein
VAQVWVWPVCTFPGCDHKRTWREIAQAQLAYQRHSSWVVGDRATCYCHGLLADPTFPCDVTEKAMHSE